MNAAVLASAVGPDGKMYFGGEFTTANSGTVNYICSVKSGAVLFLASMGGGMDDNVHVIAVDENGLVYVGGEFTTAGVTTANKIAVWNGSLWSTIDNDINNTVYSLLPDGERLYVGGGFTNLISSTFADYISIFNGTTNAHVDIKLPVGSAVLAIAKKGYDIYLGTTGYGTAYSSDTNAITNTGTRTVYPTIRIKRTGGTSAIVEWIKNETTGATMWFGYSLQDGEVLTIRLTPGKRSVTIQPVWQRGRACDTAEFGLFRLGATARTEHGYRLRR